MSIYETMMVIINFNALILNAIGLFVVNRKRKADLTLEPEKLRG